MGWSLQPGKKFAIVFRIRTSLSFVHLCQSFVRNIAFSRQVYSTSASKVCSITELIPLLILTSRHRPHPHTHTNTYTHTKESHTTTATTTTSASSNHQPHHVRQQSPSAPSYKYEHWLPNSNFLRFYSHHLPARYFMFFKISLPDVLGWADGLLKETPTHPGNQSFYYICCR